MQVHRLMESNLLRFPQLTKIVMKSLKHPPSLKPAQVDLHTNPFILTRARGRGLQQTTTLPSRIGTRSVNPLVRTLLHAYNNIINKKTAPTLGLF